MREEAISVGLWPWPVEAAYSRRTNHQFTLVVLIYCATFGENGVVNYLANLFKDEVNQDLENKTFTLQNGKRYLSRCFNSVDTLLYDDELQVTSIDDLVKYIQSFKGISEIGSLEEEIIRKRLETEFNNGMLIIPKEYGMFIARKES